MIDILVRAAVLLAHARGMWPAAPGDKLAAAAVASARAETAAIPAELLLAISQHESDLEPDAVSWRSGGRTTSQLLRTTKVVIPAVVVFGYLQAVGTRERAAVEIARDGGMSAGVAELAEWAATCRGDLACVARGHAGGTACALRERCSANARAFADLFIGNARRLGMPARRTAS